MTVKLEYEDQQKLFFLFKHVDSIPTKCFIVSSSIEPGKCEAITT